MGDIKHRGITDVIFCGDFFHDRDSVAVNTVQIACDIIKRFGDIRLHLFPGNHDCFYKEKADINSLSIFEGRNNVVVHNSPSRITIGDSCIATLCPWGTSLNDIEKCDVIFGHFEIQTFKMNTFRVCEEGLSIRKLLEKAPLIFSGHFHFRDERLFEIGRIVYVGNPFQTDLNDANNEKGYYILDADSKQYEFISNEVSPLIHRIKLSTLCMEETDIVDIHSMVRGNIITFVIDENLTNEDNDFLVSKISSFEPLQIFFETEVPSNIKEEANAAFEGVDIGTAIIEFIDIMNPNYKADVQSYALDLYRKFK